jgi:hypothetical protein
MMYFCLDDFEYLFDFRVILIFKILGWKVRLEDESEYEPEYTWRRI